jgi:acyl-CoA thioester hydrolase
MEVGRNDLAGKFGLNAEQICEAGYLAPVVALELKYKRPARFDEELRILTTVKRTETATLEFLCDIVGPDGSTCASGRSVHVLTDKNGILQFTLPPDISERIKKMHSYLEV